MSDYAIPKAGVAYIFYAGLVSQLDTKLIKSAPTLAIGDFKVSIDGGAYANLATLPTNTPLGSPSVKISLSIAEMSGASIAVSCADAAGAEWCDQFINIQTASRATADLATPTNITVVGSVTNAVLLPTMPTDWVSAVGVSAAAVTKVQTGLVTPALLTTAINTGRTTQMAESYAADGVAPTTEQALFLLMQNVGEVAISGTVKTVKKLDGLTAAATYTLDSASNPTSSTRTT